MNNTETPITALRCQECVQLVADDTTYPVRRRYWVANSGQLHAFLAIDGAGYSECEYIALVDANTPDEAR